MLDRLNKLIKQYTYSCTTIKKISIITDNKNDQLLQNILKDNKNANISNLTSDFSTICLIIIKYKNTNGVITNFINNNVNKKIILIVEKDFDFDNLIKTSKAHSINAVILKNESEYFIIVSSQ